MNVLCQGRLAAKKATREADHLHLQLTLGSHPGWSEMRSVGRCERAKFKLGGKGYGYLLMIPRREMCVSRFLGLVLPGLHLVLSAIV